MIQVREQYGNIYVRILDTYETFDHTLERILRIEQRSFKANTGEWMFPKESIGDLLLNFNNQIVWTQPLSEIAKGIKIDNALVKKHISWSENDDFSSWKMPPYPYQKVGSHFLADRGRAAIFDGVGLGKTPQVLGACQVLFSKGKANKVLIITLNALKRQWAREVEKFMGLPAIAVVGTASRRKKLIKGFAQRDDIQFLIINYETLKSENYFKEIMSIPFDVVALDEAQMIKNGVTDKLLKREPSQNAAACQKLIPKIPYRFIATATPIQSKPDEIWSLFHFVDPDILGSWEYFRERYCKYHPKFGITGAQNEGELHYKISPAFIRRTKEMPEIQQQLPKVKHDHVFLEMTDTQDRLQQIILEKIEELKEESRTIGPSGKYVNGQMLSRDEAEEYYDGMIQGYTSFLLGVCDAPELLSKSDSVLATRLLDDNGFTPKDLVVSPKLNQLVDFYEQMLRDEPSSKIVVFTRFERMASLIYEHPKIKDSAVIYTGQVSEREKELAVERFRNDPSAKMFVATDAGSTGLNLQVANYLVHIDLPWDPTMIEQRNGRIDRTGNEFPNITIMYYVMEESYDEHLLGLLEKKADLATSILEGGRMKSSSGNYNKLAIDRLMKNQAKKQHKKLLAHA